MHQYSSTNWDYLAPKSENFWFMFKLELFDCINQLVNMKNNIHHWKSIKELTQSKGRWMNQVQKGQGSEQLKNLSKPGGHVSQGFTARVIVFQQLSAFVSRFKTRESSLGHKLTLWLREGLALNWQSHQATFCRVEVISPKEMGCCCYNNRELLYRQIRRNVVGRQNCRCPLLSIYSKDGYYRKDSYVGEFELEAP